MGLFSGIKKAVSGAVKTVAKTVIGSVTSGLKSITDGFINQGAGLLKGLAGKALSRLPAPARALSNLLGLNKLAGKGIDSLANQLKSAKNEGIDAFMAKIQQLVSQPSQRTTSDGVSVTPPSLEDRLKEILDLLKQVSGGTASTSSSSASSTSSTASSSGAASTSGAASASGTAATSGAADPNSLSSLLSGVKAPDLNATMATMNDPKKSQQEKDMAMMQYQEQMQAYNRMISMITNMMQMQHDTQKAIIQNFRA
ncbi:MAG: hypothetical protein FWC28_04665 [Proteobacteria bacterium]|nr:hypothetical protein [Pseudomonadota bacterium]